MRVRRTHAERHVLVKHINTERSHKICGIFTCAFCRSASEEGSSWKAHWACAEAAATIDANTKNTLPCILYTFFDNLKMLINFGRKRTIKMMIVGLFAACTNQPINSDRKLDLFFDRARSISDRSVRCLRSSQTGVLGSVRAAA